MTLQPNNQKTKPPAGDAQTRKKGKNNMQQPLGVSCLLSTFWGKLEG